jgi:hypothetical protein
MADSTAASSAVVAPESSIEIDPYVTGASADGPILEELTIERCVQFSGPGLTRSVVARRTHFFFMRVRAALHWPGS